MCEDIVVRNYFLFVVLLCLVVPVSTALSFDSAPVITTGGSNVTTTDPFSCAFTSAVDASANITWFRSSNSYTANDQSVSVTQSSPVQSNPISISATSKDQTWLCQVILYNATDSITQNSSSISVVNTLPQINTPSQLVFYEDTTASFTFTASDPDNDVLSWFSDDTSSSQYGGSELFDITTAGVVTINQVNEDLVGNHSMRIIAEDEPASGSTKTFLFELKAVNDAPVITDSTLSYTCNEAQSCQGQIQATDEDNASNELTFIFNETFINASSDGSFSFVPTYAQSQQQNYSIQVIVSDGNKSDTDVVNLTIISQNHAPNISYSTTSGSQNDSLFTWQFNATDSLDPNDAFNFSVETSCPLANPWSISTESDGLGGSTAVGLINTSLTSNDYVVCRDVTIVLQETDTSSGQPRATYNYNITLNISNINDAPILHELNSNEAQQNMSDLTAALGLSFSYVVNATDVDQLTYQGDTLTYALQNTPVFPAGAEMFTINNLTGNISAVQAAMNASYAGAHDFTVVVYDSLSPQLNDTRNISVTVAFNELPQLFTVNQSTCFDNVLCTKNISASDAEAATLTVSFDFLSVTNPLNQTANSSNSTYISQLLGINTIPMKSGNVSTFLLNFTPDDVDRGNYTINYTIYDDVGNSNSSSFSFFINNTIEPPRFDDDGDNNTLELVSFKNIYETVPFSEQFYMFDDDLVFNSDNLTFNYTFNNNASLPGFSLKQVNNTLVHLNFTPTLFDSGDYSINITVTDKYNLSANQTVNFTIYDTSTFPNITHVRPYNTGGSIVQSFAAIDSNEVRTNLSFQENTSIVFDLNAFDADNQSMNVSWYVNGSLNFSVPYGVHNYTRFFDFFDKGVYNITVKVSDFGFDHFTWIVNITEFNRPPQFVNPARNLTGASAVQGSSAVLFNNFFFLNWNQNIVFYDPDDDENGNGEIDLANNESNGLNFTVNASGSCDEIATFAFVEDDDLSITPLDSGVCETNFIASDSAGETAVSNTILIQVIKTESSSSSSSSSGSGTRTITETVTVPLEEPVDVPEELDIIYPGITTMYSNNTAIIPLTIRNEWDDVLNGITLNLNSSDSGISYSFGQSYIPTLRTGQSVDMNLTLQGYRTDGPIALNVSAFVGSLQYTDYETINLNALEKGKEDLNALRSRISFARDLLVDNPECGELLEVLEEAEKNPQGSSIEIINSVINGCKYLLGDSTNRSDAFPKSFSGRLNVYAKNVLDYDMLFTVLGGLAGIAIATGLFVRFSMKKI